MKQNDFLKDKKEIKDGFFNKFLNIIEKGGNALPHPVTLFGILSLLVIALSVFFKGTEVTFMRKSEMVTTTVVSLGSAAGLRHIFGTMVSNFTGFAPLGTVLVALLGVGVCEGSGLMSAILKNTVNKTPKKFLTGVLVFLGIMSNIASDAGYVVLIPLGAIIFLSVGRHPIAGLAATFAGVSGGFSANLLIGTLDPLLGGISTEAAKLISPEYVVLPTANYYFMFASTFIITILGTYVTEKIVVPRLGKYTGDEVADLKPLSDLEKKGLSMAGNASIIFIAIMLLLTWKVDAPLRLNGSLNAFLSKGLVPTLMFFFLIPGIVYGKIVGTIKSEKDVCAMMGKAMSSMGGYLVLAFAASQFIAFFNYSNLGTVLAVKGAEGLSTIGFTGLPLLLAFIVLAGFINLFMGSASAKWAIMAPVFIPMLMQLGYTPELTQVAYRIGDSTTNLISPLMSYFAFIVVFCQKYDKKAGLGTLISTMMPYSLVFLLGWSIMFAIWFSLGLPLGPGSAIHLI